MPSKPKVTKPDSYQGFIDSRIELNPLSESVVKYESFKLPKAFYVEFSLIDWASKKPTRDGNVIYSKWFVGLVLELTEFGTPELLELRIKGSAKDDGGENFRTGFYKGFTKNARPVAKWQTDFVNHHIGLANRYAAGPQKNFPRPRRPQGFIHLREDPAGLVERVGNGLHG